MPDVALLHHHYGPYHIARVRALQQRLPGQLHFIQLASEESAREWRVGEASPDIITIATGTLEHISQRRLAALTVSALDRLRPNVVIVAGYAHAAMRAAAAWCRRMDAVAILLSDSHRVDRRRHRLKEWAKRAWVSRHFDAVFAAGAKSAVYAESLGFEASAIWRGYDVVDNSFFADRAASARMRGSSLLSDLGLPERVFLYVGRFSLEKNLDRLLDALVEYRRRAGSDAWGLLLVGSGKERDSLQRRVRALRGSVAMTGFKQVDELAEVYAGAAALILPSTSEPWGLVVNEAMACRLPVLVSERAGAALDLVFPGINGYVFDPEDTEDMVSAMLRMASQQVDRRAMGLASERIVANFTPETWATALADCVEVTMERRGRAA